MKHRIAILVAAVVVLTATAVTYVLVARESPAANTVSAAVTLDPGTGLLVVLNRHLAVVDKQGTAKVSAVECVRVYAAAGTGVCLQPESPWAYRLAVLDTTLNV